MNTDLQRLSARFHHFAQAECPEEPLYQALCRIVADDASLLDLLSGASDEQRRPNLWLAAVHERVLAGNSHALAAYYASVGGQRAPDASLAACVKDFVAAHEPTLRERMRTQTTQTNEIGRCAVLWLALRDIAQRSGQPRLALLDVGCSAGLNLGVDAYRYDYGEAVLGAAAHAEVPTVPCQLVGPLPSGADFQIVQRCGIDPAPVAIDDEAALGWLRACLWPSHTQRAQRFAQAVALQRENRWPVLKVADSTAYVAGWLASLPDDVQPVVFNSWVLTYFETAARARHIETLTGLVRRTGATWLSAEGEGLHIGPVVGPPREARPASWWTLCSRVGGEVRFDVLARSHGHGHWLEWLAR